MTETIRGYVVIKKGKFYVNPRRFTDDLDLAKAFYSKGTARKVAKRIGGDYREVVITL